LNEESELSPQRHGEHGGRVGLLKHRVEPCSGHWIKSSGIFEFLILVAQFRGKTKNQEINSMISVSSVVKRPFGKIGFP
jgi:hypothetical protein